MISVRRQRIGDAAPERTWRGEVKQEPIGRLGDGHRRRRIADMVNRHQADGAVFFRHPVMVAMQCLEHLHAN